MSTTVRSVPDGKRRKRARKFFIALLKRLKKAYKVIKTADQWYEFARQVQSMLPEYEDVLSPVDAQRLKAALQLTDTSHEGISRAIDVLEFELEHVVSVLPSGGALGAVILGAAVVVAAGVGATCIALNASAVEIVVKNNGCAPIPICQGVIPALDWISGAVGISLPEQPIQSDAQDSISFPPLVLTVDATTRRKVSFQVMGLALPFSLSVDVDSIRFDGKELLGAKTPIDLRGAAQHEFVVTCY